MSIALGILATVNPLLSAQGPKLTYRIGQEVAIPRHLQEDEEFSVPLPELLDYGKKLFIANWTDQEGGGRPQSKGKRYWTEHLAIVLQHGSDRCTAEHETRGC